MKARQTSIGGLWYIELDVHGDERGSFREAYQAEKLAKLGVPPIQPVQWNISESAYGTIRGMHAEPWEKYIHMPFGTAFSAIVDLRPDSPTFKKVETFELNSSNALQLPRGMANGFAATSEKLVYAYLVTEHWRPDGEYQAIAYNDSDLAIDWPIPEADRIVSDKDQANPTLQEALGGA